MRTYQAVYKYFRVIEPNWSSVPRRRNYKRENKISDLFHEFNAENDDSAINIAKQYPPDFYETTRNALPNGSKKLANKPVLENLVEIMHPREVLLNLAV